MKTEYQIAQEILADPEKREQAAFGALCQGN